MDKVSNNHTLVEDSLHIQEVTKEVIQDRGLHILEAVERGTHNHLSMDSLEEIREVTPNSTPNRPNNNNNNINQGIHRILHNRTIKVDSKDPKVDSSRTKDTDNQ